MQNRPHKRIRAFSMLELIIAVLMLGVAALGAIATWQVSTEATRTKRITEIASYIGVQQMERTKAQKYDDLTSSATASTDYYDNNGNHLSSSTGSTYSTTTLVYCGTTGGTTYGISRGSTTSTADMLEIVVKVFNSAGTEITGARTQTLISFGGL